MQVTNGIPGRRGHYMLKEEWGIGEEKVRHMACRSLFTTDKKDKEKRRWRHTLKGKGKCALYYKM